MGMSMKRFHCEAHAIQNNHKRYMLVVQADTGDRRQEVDDDKHK